MKYRKKPVVIEAFQFKSDWKTGTVSFPLWASEAVSNGTIALDLDPGKAFIETLEGRMTANDQDWIIKGVKGEIYPCKPDIFAATYEAV